MVFSLARIEETIVVASTSSGGGSRGKRKDDFPERVKRVLAQRAAYTCSNPDCRSLTIGPASDPQKSSLTGEAAHVCSAEPGGARYDESQSSQERKNITNAIWLCS